MLPLQRKGTPFERLSTHKDIEFRKKSETGKYRYFALEEEQYTPTDNQIIRVSRTCFLISEGPEEQAIKQTSHKMC